MSSKRIYNRVMQANNVCPLGELLTDKELERILSSPYGKALDTKDYGVCLGVIAARREPLREFQPGDYVDWHGYSATVIDVDGDFITLDVCGEEVYTDTQELIQQQL